jgi:TatD DNase family protein
MFFHNRNTNGDFVNIIRTHRDQFDRGVVHSFTGTLEEAKQLMDLGLFIGINGCSLKTEENLHVVRCIPLSHMVIETGKYNSLH